MSISFRNKFQQELETLNLELIDLGAIVIDTINDSIKALIEHNVELCEAVIQTKHAGASMIDDIEDKALKILLMQQPVASDLRTISTALKIVADMDKISRQAREICHIVIDIGHDQHTFDIDIIKDMSKLATDMVSSCVESFVKLDISIANQVIDLDNKMDALFKLLKQEMLEKIKNRAEDSDQALYFMMIGKYLEKIGDYAESVAQWVIYSKTGMRK